MILSKKTTSTVSVFSIMGTCFLSIKYFRDLPAGTVNAVNVLFTRWVYIPIKNEIPRFFTNIIIYHNRLNSITNIVVVIMNGCN